MDNVYKFFYPLLAVGFIVLGGFLVFTLVQESEDEVTDESESIQQSDTHQEAEAPTAEESLRAITFAEVAAANTLDNCYLVYEGNVYDIPRDYSENEHPIGSDSIESRCGTDATGAFQGAHDNLDFAESVLEPFLIGELVEEEIVSDSAPESISEAAGAFTQADVIAANNIDEECLVIYENNVYDIPADWADQHPGGSFRVTNACGRDITSEFDSSHAGSAIALQQLEAYFAGTLVE